MAVGSGVAQAQSCQARAESSEIVRAEGITEMVGNIELQCRRPSGDTDSFFDATIPEMLDITVQLNTNITNEISDARVVKLEDRRTWLPGWRNYVEWPPMNSAAATFTIGRDGTVAAANFGDGELSDDGDAIEWTEIATSGLNLD